MHLLQFRKHLNHYPAAPTHVLRTNARQEILIVSLQNVRTADCLLWASMQRGTLLLRVQMHSDQRLLSILLIHYKPQQLVMGSAAWQTYLKTQQSHALFRYVSVYLPPCSLA